MFMIINVKIEYWGDKNMLDIKIERATKLKEIPGEDNPLLFGTIFTDHMFIMDPSLSSSTIKVYDLNILFIP